MMHGGVQEEPVQIIINVISLIELNLRKKLNKGACFVRPYHFKRIKYKKAVIV